MQFKFVSALKTVWEEFKFRVNISDKHGVWVIW